MKILKIVEEKPEEVKGQHFLCTPMAKNLTPKDLDKLSDDEIKELFMVMLYGVPDKQACPHCGVLDKHYPYKKRDIYKCKHCRKQFSLTSGTVFAYHKLSLREILGIGLSFITSVKGVSALELSREFRHQYKTIFSLVHKLREGMEKSCFIDFEKEKNNDGPTHIDGTYIHTNIRKANKKEDRIDARLAKNANPNKRCIFAMVKERSKKETENNPHLKGSKVVLPFIINSETSNVVKELVTEHIKKDSIIHADESNAYDDLMMNFNLKRVNHSKEYRSDEGITNNHAESFFSRFKRGLKGQYHNMSNKYLDAYSFEIAFRENKRRASKIEQLKAVMQCCLHKPTSVMRGYWQGKAIKEEVLYV